MMMLSMFLYCCFSPSFLKKQEFDPQMPMKLIQVINYAQEFIYKIKEEEKVLHFHSESGRWFGYNIKVNIRMIFFGFFLA